MKLQGGVEYLLLIGGIVVVSLVIGSVLTQTTQTLSKNLTSYNAPEVNYPPAYADSPPTILDFSVSPSSPSTDDNVTLYCSASDDVTLSSIKIYLNGSLAGECSYQNLSSYSCSSTLSPLPPGTYTAECIATDSNNQSSSSSLTFTVTPSNNPPSITITSPSDGDTINSSSVTIQWTASDPDGDPLTFSVDCDNDGTPEATGITSTSYTCSYSSGGTYTAKVTASDGFTTADDTVTFTVNIPSGDTTPPTITSFSANPSTITEGSSTTLSCSATDNVALYSIKIYKNATDSSPAKTCYSSPCSATVTYYSAGTHTAKCVATDTSGNSSSKTTTVNVTSSGGGGSSDTTPPSVTASVSPTSGDETTTFTISCSASDDNAIQSIKIFVDGNKLRTCSATTSCSYSSTFPVGDHTATCTAYDYAGNNSSDSDTFTVTSSSCTDECTGPVTECCGADVCQYPCRDTDGDGCNEVDYSNGQVIENCGSYSDGWYECSSSSCDYEYRDYDGTCSNGQCAYTVTQTCSNECTLGDTRRDYTGECGDCELNGKEGKPYKDYKCVSDADSDPCTEWEYNRSGCNTIACSGSGGGGGWEST